LVPVIAGLAELRVNAAPNVVDGVTLDLARITPLLDELEPLLEKMDLDAEDKAQELERLFHGSPHAACARDLLKQVNAFDFERAGRALARLRERLNHASCDD
jgi:hypothetical protein